MNLPIIYLLCFAMNGSWSAQKFSNGNLQIGSFVQLTVQTSRISHLPSEMMEKSGKSLYLKSWSQTCLTFLWSVTSQIVTGHMEFYRQSEKTCWYRHRKNAEYWPWQSARLTISLMLWLCISESFLHFGRMVHPAHLCVQVTHENVFVKYFDWVIIK